MFFTVWRPQACCTIKCYPMDSIIVSPRQKDVMMSVPWWLGFNVPYDRRLYLCRVTVCVVHVAAKIIMICIVTGIA